MQLNKSKTKLPPNPQAEWSFEAIGTSWWIGIYQPIATAELAQIKQKVHAVVTTFDTTYSRFKTDSWVAGLATPGDYRLPPDAAPLLALYRRLYDATDGLVTPLIGQLLVDAGYDATYSLQPGELRPTPAWDKAIVIAGDTLRVLQPITLDVGAAGKGYLVDILADVLQAAGLLASCIDASGDLRCQGISQPLRIGMEHPSDPSQVIGIVDLQDQALCASAPWRRQWAGYHHIMDPQKRNSPRHIAAVWVISQRTAVADGLATALFFVEADRLRDFQFEYCVLYADGSITRSNNFPVELYLQ